MFGDIDKKLIKYFKIKEESPLAILKKLMKKEDNVRKNKEKKNQ